MKGIRLAAFFAALALAAGPVGAESRIEEVSLFKNGLGYFVERLDLSPSETSVRLGTPRPALHGTYWFRSDPSLALVRKVTAARVDSAILRPAASLAELLPGLVGREVTLRVNEETHSGILRRVLGGGGSGVTPYSELRASMIRPLTQDVVILEENGIQTAIAAHAVTNLRSAGAIPAEIAETITVPVLTLEYSGVAAAPLEVSYLRKDISWAPAYRLDITDSPGHLTLQANVINDAADLHGIRLNLISGFPNIQMDDVVSPLALTQNLGGFLGGLGGGGVARRRESNMMSQMTMNARGNYGDAEEAPTYSVTTPGGFAEDLFYYTLEDFSLASGARAAVDVAAGPVPFEHVYLWNVEPRGGPRGGGQGQGEAGEDVWHTVRFRNTLGQPLTTGPALVVSHGRIVAQDLVNYTSAGGTGRVRITKALDIRAESEELEKERERGARVIRGSHYDLVTVEGTLSLTSYKAEPVRLEITRVVEGEFVSAAGNPEVTRLAEALSDANPRTRLQWDLTLAPGEKAEIRYLYRTWVP